MLADEPAKAQELLARCVRDLAALNALPSMCVGCSPEQALALLLDALPTVLHCNLLCVALPEPMRLRHGWLDGAALNDTELDQLADAAYVDGSDVVLYCRQRKLYCLQLDIPLSGGNGRLVAGREVPLDATTDRVLFRGAANLFGTTLQSASLLDIARRKDDFIAMLGHELRNPLASILAAVELLQQKAALGHEHRVIERHTRHIARLVDDLLDVSRASRGQLELRPDYVALSTVLERAAEIAEPLIHQHKHSLRILGGEGITLFADPVRLAQLFGNLLTNSAKFTPPGGEISVSVERVSDRVRVRVRDNGRGLEREQLLRIFEPFVQVHSESPSASTGLGLGLAIVRMLVERHSGRISASSEGLGRGSTFDVELPTVEAAPTRVAQEMKPRKAARAKVRVLVVDDNADMTELLCEALSLAGFETAGAYDAFSALERWPQFQPHTAILDVGLPVIDGCELAKRLRVEYGAQPLLIAATGYGQPSDRARATEAGFDFHLVKPVSVSDLVKLLDERCVQRQEKAESLVLAQESATQHELARSEK